MKNTILVIAPHPDDEVLGVGGTIARSVEDGAAVHVAIVTRGTAPAFSEERVRAVRDEAEHAHRELGVTSSHFLDLPAALLDTVAHREVNGAFAALFATVRPDVVYLPFSGDIHRDHQLVALSGLVAGRPSEKWRPREIYAYETLSETNWNAPYISPSFAPNVFVDVSGHLERKIAAMLCYGSQVRPHPDERSIESVRALATLRGATVGVAAAEAFVALRIIVSR